MPLVVARGRSVEYVENEAILGEILGHTNFDDRDWAAGVVAVLVMC